jgi:hypothetical protein
MMRLTFPGPCGWRAPGGNVGASDMASLGRTVGVLKRYPHIPIGRGGGEAVQVR